MQRKIILENGKEESRGPGRKKYRNERKTEIRGGEVDKKEERQTDEKREEGKGR